MTKAEEAGQAPDPYEVWRQVYETNERAWSSALEQAMGSPEFGESSGKLLETLLAAQKSSRDNMRVYLETMNVPTREDIARLGELVIGLEEKIDQLADRLDSIEGALRAKPAAAAATKPAARAKSAASPKPATRTKRTTRGKSAK
jgi:polyhydroxyalkanoic acid synthase PhaR subunit